MIYCWLSCPQIFNPKLSESHFKKYFSPLHKILLLIFAPFIYHSFYDNLLKIKFLFKKNKFNLN